MPTTATASNGNGSGSNLQAIISRSVSGGLSLIGLQIFTRIITFVLNNIIIRTISEEYFGIYSIQYQFYISTVLFLTREGFRRACLRSEININMNLAWLSIPTGIVVSLLVGWIFSIYMFASEIAQIPSYYDSFCLFGVGSILEIFSEPMYILAQNLLLYRVRVGIEIVATVTRCVLTYYLIVTNEMGLVGFGYAQVAYGLVMIVLYYGYFVHYILVTRPRLLRSKNKEILPLRNISQLFPHFTTKLPNEKKIDRELVWFLITYTWQSVQKLILGEGEKFVLIFSETLFNQGVYSVVNNLGSLITRFLFQPVEETCFSLFSKLLGTTNTEPRQEDIEATAWILQILTKLVLLIGLVFITFGSNYSDLVLFVLYNTKFVGTTTSQILSWYCVYVAIMGINGITEAFVQSVASQTQLSRYNYLLVFFAIVYMITATFLIRLIGTVGLILANCVNMLLRIVYSLYFIQRYFEEKDPKGPRVFSWRQFPSLQVSFVFFVCYVLGYLSFWRFYQMETLTGKLLHGLVGCGLLVLLLGVIYLKDRKFCNEIASLLKKRNVE